MKANSGAKNLIVICPENGLLEQISSSDRDQFAAVFAFSLYDNLASQANIRILSAADIGASVLNRLRFLADPAHLPALLAPILLRKIWASDKTTGDAILWYPGVPFDRILAAVDMLDASCDAVLLRFRDRDPLILGLARNTQNERMVLHWADRVEQSSFQAKQGTDPAFDWSGRMAEYICDRTASLRMPDNAGIAGPQFDAKKEEFSPAVRSALESLLPESPLLQEDPIENALQVLNSPASRIQQDPQQLITELMAFIWSTRQDLQRAFDLSNSTGRCGFVDWFLERASVELALDARFIQPVQAAREQPQVVDHTDALAPDADGAKTFSPQRVTAGVNLIGYPRAEMGMGEQLRTCASALTAVDFPFGIYDFHHGLVASNQDNRFEHHIRPDNPFDINLFHINADQMPLALEKLGRQFFRDRYNIAYWEWELSRFPDEWLPSIDLVDEIWAPSKFIGEAISKKTSKPVVHMPLAIEFPLPSALTSDARQKFGLPEDKFLFLFPFDFSSFSTRKNYPACLDAFCKAFKGSRANVGLVLKTISHSHHLRDFWDLLRSIGKDPRIYVIDRILRRAEMHELIASCDSLVSLHRSEGFGLGIAEAMYLGKPVIVTNYSGNTDFTREDNSCLVDYKLIPVRDGEYIYPEGQVWADPNTDMAAEYMRRLVEDREYGRRIGKAAAKFIRQQHNCGVIGKRYISRLRQIIAARDALASSVTGDSDQNTGVRTARLLDVVHRFF